VTLANTLKLTAAPAPEDTAAVEPAIALMGNAGSMFTFPDIAAVPDIVTDMLVFTLYK